MAGSGPDTGAVPDLGLDLIDWDAGEGPSHVPRATVDYWMLLMGAISNGRLLSLQLERNSPIQTL